MLFSTLFLTSQGQKGNGTLTDLLLCIFVNNYPTPDVSIMQNSCRTSFLSIFKQQNLLPSCLSKLAATSLWNLENEYS